MHIFEGSGGPTIPFTDISWEKFIKSVFLWKDLEGREGIIAEEAVQAYKLQSQEPTNQLVKPANTGYHRECYSHFTNITKIKRAQRRREKAVLVEETAKEGWYYIV